ncbi:MAG: hypothetical protein J3Q66DRAFT_375398 [Benniella sp.]|nr:MAG: hypothetical protein J3Q66DRAFT_375398 [Benniella sp.]
MAVEPVNPKLIQITKERSPSSTITLVAWRFLTALQLTDKRTINTQLDCVQELTRSEDASFFVRTSLKALNDVTMMESYLRMTVFSHYSFTFTTRWIGKIECFDAGATGQISPNMTAILREFASYKEWAATSNIWHTPDWNA